MRLSARILALLLLGGLAATCPATPMAAVFRSFDGPELTWQLSGNQAGAQVLAHGCVADDARQGSGSERLVIATPGGDALHFTCEVGHLPVLEELEARLWVKANRPGVTLAARVMLPRAVDAKTGLPRTALVCGDQCELPDRWQQLRLANVTSLLAAEARVMRASHGVAIDTREAFVDAVLLVVPGGPNRTAVWTDALEVDGIVMPAGTNVKRSASKPKQDPEVKPAQHWQLARTPTPQLPTAPPAIATAPQVQFQGATLLVDGRPFLPLGIEWNGEPIPFLAARGFNTIWLDKAPMPEQTADAARVNVWFVCKPPKPEAIDDVGLGDSLDRVLAWNLGSPSGPQELDYFRRWADMVRERDAATARPIIISPRGDWMPTSRHADVLVADHPMSTRLSGADFVEWFATLPNLARPGTPLWACIPTQAGPRARQQVSVLAPDARLKEAALDEQNLESLAMAAATNGCRGFVMRSDSPLHAADEATKRRAVIVETLNNELAMLAPWLTIGKRIGKATSTDTNVSATLLQVERARLLMPTLSTAAAGAQTSAFIVPGIPVSNQAYLLSPALMQSLPSKRVAGGTRVEFEPASVLGVLLTEDLSVISGFRQRVASGGRRAAQLQYSLAASRLQTLSAASPRLASFGINTKGLDQSLGSANAEIGKANAALVAGKIDLAYSHASAARGILGNAYQQIEGAANNNGTVLSLPFGQSDESLLPRQTFEKSVAALRGGENQLAGGDFEDLGQLQQLGWQHIDDPIAGINSQVKLSAKNPREGRYCLELSALAAPSGTTPQVVARPLVWITSSPALVKTGDIVEITGWVRVEQPITGSIAGLQIIDSLGGPELALRVRSTNDWQAFRLLRGTSDTTEITLTFALEGIGAASIDSVMVRSLAAPSVKRLPEVTGQPGLSFPNSADRSLFGPPLER